MTVVNQFSSKRVLVIDDQAGMRTQLQMSLTHSGFEKLHVVASIKEALSLMNNGHYDIILCDYFLGEGTNGQQFLEYLRNRDLISRNTIFIMITAESSYESVVTAAECAPDDYLLKPFTAEQLNNRLGKLLERQSCFAAIDKAADAKDWERVAAQCDEVIAVRDKFFIEASKIKGEALLKSGHAPEAAALYTEMLALRPLPWAKLGLARALALNGSKDQAAALARELVAEHDHYMGAYDFLGGVLAETGDKEAALEILQSARQVSPGTLNRVRHVAELAVDTGRHDVAEQIMTEALAKHKYSPVREAQDYAILSKAINEQGKPEKALAVLKEAKQSFSDEASSVLLTTSEIAAHRKAGNNELAEAALSQALAAHHGDLPPSVVAAVADACFALGKEQQATDLLKQLVQNNPDDTAAQEKVHTVLTAAGKGEAEATAMIAASVQEIIQLNNEGVRKAEAGELNEAVSLLCDAADRLPNNLQIVGNAALALALDLARSGYTSIKMHECTRLRQLVAAKSPDYPKLAQIDAVLKKVSQE
ncbi:MAG TPA: response regulator [Novimethylophilus sp.]|jgi:CheY-like chemotaxis protein|uniref:response regulator n=1 Tax=Novimethylophilus sp. TaxID=2137426 RepID=UPI002F41D84B